ncbi:hypothetical protein [Haloarchaeobius sp. TZWWS8]|uniref:hypothetical protein n=1 Tax=Haloarchaeobius sp. TZWWS8 TaxID=3446121 RepID=UPI003EBDAEC1
MKTGAGDDPFAQDPVEEPVDEEPEDGEISTEDGVDADAAETEPVDAEPEAEEQSQEPQSGGADADGSNTTMSAEKSDDSGGLSAEDIPWVLRRSAVKEDRDNVHQFFLRDEYSEREDELRSEVADLLDMRTKDVKKLDLREAMVAAADPEAIAAELESWGYEYLD